MWTMTLPVLSTGHISQTTCRRLSNYEAEPIGGVSAIAEYETGFFIQFDEATEAECALDDLAAIRTWAKANHQSSWVRLDSCGSDDDGLPMYDW